MNAELSRRIAVAVIALAIVSGTPAPAQQQPSTLVANVRPAATVPARAAAQAPVIDGRDRDPIWASATWVSDFRQLEPEAGADPSFRTEFSVAHDERNLYAFVR